MVLRHEFSLRFGVHATRGISTNHNALDLLRYSLSDREMADLNNVFGDDLIKNALVMP